MKRTICMFLIIALLAGMMPANAWAEKFISMEPESGNQNLSEEHVRHQKNEQCAIGDPVLSNTADTNNRKAESAHEANIPEKTIQENTAEEAESNPTRNELLTASATRTEVAEVVAGGSCGENLIWSLDAAGTLEISGSGGYSHAGLVPWHEYRDDIVTIIIGENVTSLGDNMFYATEYVREIIIAATALEDLTNSSDTFAYSGSNSDGIKVTFAANVTRVPAYLFCAYGAASPNIKQLAFEEDSTCLSIGAYAFAWCEGITSVSLPEKVMVIGEYAFYSCNSYSLTIPEDVKSIGVNAFHGFTNLHKLHFNAVAMEDMEYNNATFQGAGSESEGIVLTIGSCVTRIPAFLFLNFSEWSPKIASVIFEEGSICESIGDSAFGYLSLLNEIELPDSLQVIEESAFYRCESLKEITIPENMKQIGANAFAYCYNIEMIRFNATSIQDFNSSSCVFHEAGCDTSTKVIIGANVTKIPDYFLYTSGGQMDNISSIVFEKGSECETIGYDAFASCTSLSEIIIPDGVEQLEGYAFSGCITLKKVVIPASVTTFGYSVFSECPGLITAGPQDGSYNICFGWTDVIPTNAFYGCTGLRDITIPESIIEISNNAFNCCTALKQINFNAVEVSDFSNKNDVFYKAGTAGDGITVTFGKNVKRVPAYLFRPYTSSEVPTNLVKVVFLGTQCESIGDYAFYGCLNLQSVGFPDGLRSIGQCSFQNCSALMDAQLPEELTAIGRYAFQNCTNLDRLYLPKDLNSIGSYAFSGCKGLTEIEYNITALADLSIGNGLFSSAGTASEGITVRIGDNVETIPSYLFSPYSHVGENNAKIVRVAFGSESVCRRIGEGAFRHCAGLRKINVPQSVTSIGSSAFAGCTLLTSAGPIGSKADYQFGWTDQIPDYAFYGCRGLVTALLPDSITRIGQEAFSGCYALTQVSAPADLTTIGSQAFYHCESLSCITIPEKVTTIGKEAFCGCINLARINFDAMALSGVTGSDHIFGDSGTECGGMTVVFGKYVTYVPDYLFSRNSYPTAKPPYLKAIEFESGSICSTIGSYAFNTCFDLYSVEVPESIEIIRTYAFDDCDSLTEVYYGGSEEAWKENVSVASGNNDLYSAEIHYNSEVPDSEPDPDVPGSGSEMDEDKTTRSYGSVMYLSAWDAQRQVATLGVNYEVEWKTSEETDPDFLTSAAGMVGQFVLVKTIVPEGGFAYYDSILINAVPVETYIGYVSYANTESMMINGVTYDTPEDWSVPGIYAGEEVVYYLKHGQLVGISTFQTETGVLHFWSTETRRLSIDPDGLSNGLGGYMLSTLSTEESTDFLGVTGHTNVAIMYKKDSNNFIYNVSKYIPNGEPDFYDTYVPMTEDEERFYEIAEDWMEAYEALTDAAYQAMMVQAGATEEIREDIISRQAAAMKKSDSQSDSHYLSGNLGSYADEAYHALAVFLYDYTCKNAEFAETNLSEAMAGSTIVNNVMKSMWNANKSYVYEDVSITISVSGYGAVGFGHMTIEPHAGQSLNTIVICSNLSDCEAAVQAFVDELKGLAANATYNVVNAVYKDILGKSLSSLTKEYVSDVVSKIEKKTAVILSEKFNKAGIGNYIQTLDECYTYYNWVYKAANSGDLDDLEIAMKKVFGLNFEDQTIKDAATNAAMKGLKKATKAMRNAYEDYLEELANQERRVCSKSYINCPVNVTVYNSAAEQIGYVGTDDIWYTDAIRITEAGGAKQIIAYTDDPLSFEITATDYGTVSCSFEEYGDDGNPIGRLNYYGIQIEPNRKLSVSLTEDLKANIDTVMIDDCGENIKASEYLDVTQSAGVIITCQIDGGGKVTGVGTHIRGDSVVLVALPEMGFGFSGWYEGETLVCGTEVCEFTAIQDMHLTAKFHREEYVYVSVESEFGGYAIGSGRYVAGDTATVIAAPSEHFGFVGWYIDDVQVSSDLVYQFTVSGDVKLTAIFACISHFAPTAEFEWSEDYMECEAKVTCAWCGVILTMDCIVIANTTPPTENEKGCIVYTAYVDLIGQRFEDTRIVMIPPLDHVIHTTTLVPYVESTCQHTGNKAYYICSGCDLWFADEEATIVIEDHNSVIIPLADHDYKATVTASTCTELGYTTYTCQCGEYYVADHVDALGHDFGAWVVIQEPTATDDGVEEHTCTRCGHVEQRRIAKLENPFNDVAPGSFYYEPVMWAIENGITNGTSATTFSPNDQCMRAHVVTFLWRAVGCPEPTRTDNPFVDVKPGDFYYKPVLWALENGITSGMDATHFGPTAYCNRAQVVTFLYRTMGNPDVGAASNPFTDVAVGSFYEKPVLWAVENGVTAGMSATSFGPNSICNRAQIVTFLYRAFVD